jgi:transcriptional/translational regulatory protein YebC/TACO1
VCAEVAVDDASYEKCEALMERLLELDDVDNVYTNCEGLTN